MHITDSACAPQLSLHCRVSRCLGGNSKLLLHKSGCYTQSAHWPLEARENTSHTWRQGSVVSTSNVLTAWQSKLTNAKEKWFVDNIIKVIIKENFLLSFLFFLCISQRSSGSQVGIVGREIHSGHEHPRSFSWLTMVLMVSFSSSSVLSSPRTPFTCLLITVYFSHI